jgi:hypothetical protein
MPLHLTLTAPAAAITATDTDTRTLAGIALPYGEAGATSLGRLTIDAGAVRVPEQLRRVKLFREHGRTTPVGYAVNATDTPEALSMTFAIGRTPDGDTALLEAAEGIRDALSVELDNVAVDAGHVVAADLVAVAQVAVPAFPHAVLTSSADPNPQPDPDEPEEDEPAEPEETSMPETTTEPVETEAPEVEATARPPQLPAERRSHKPSPSTSLFASQVSEALRGVRSFSEADRNLGELQAALADITPGNAGTDGTFMRPVWLDELWSPVAPTRRIVSAIGVKPLTGSPMQGWKWQTKPVVAPYAGNKAEIPTSPASIVPAEAAAHRIAGGWDLDRIYLDFNTGFIEAFLRAATQDYVKKSEIYLIDGHGAVTGPPAVDAAPGIISNATDLGAQASLPEALEAIVTFLTSNGANVNFLAMASDVYADFLTLPEASVPWWLKNQATVTLDGSVSVADVTIGVDPGMALGMVLGGDRTAVSLWETGPINVTAVNLPNGGIDLALFGYHANMVHDPAGLAKASVTATP